MGREANIVKQIIDYFNTAPCCASEKVKGDSTSSGKADINACYKGRSMRIEVKTPDNRNKPSKKQLVNLDKWRRAGAITMVVYSIKSFRLFMLALEKGQNGYYVLEEEKECMSWMNSIHLLE